ncbi:MAG: UDP-N-acetylglucosamine 1-carboxyvinyltransferase [Chloroflexi bacterium]|nr:UDP-N-acetylglucosamine 1-carboxyvinyltransferase [Chloroflexota bacterium]
MTAAIKISGGIKLMGEVTPVPNKNAMLPALTACLLTDETVTYQNLQKSTDVLRTLQILKNLGAEVDDSNFSDIHINCSKVKSHEVDYTNGNALRSSILFAGPLLARFGRARIPLPGGCVLGKRSISAHIDAFKKVGIRTEVMDGYAMFERVQPIQKHYELWMMEASVTATENLVMYAAGTKAAFSITEAAVEPHVTQLLKLLESFGTEIFGFESNKIRIHGKAGLKGAVFTPDPDHIDIAGLIVAAAVTKGRIVIKDSNIYRVVGGLVQFFSKFNIDIQVSGKDLIVDGSRDLVIDCVDSGFPLAAQDLPKVSPRPWPGFPVDALPNVVTLACKTRGKTLIQNWMYETGLDFIRELNVLGANIFMADPQRVIVNGPINFKGGKVLAPSIIQATQAIFLAALADPADTVIEGWDILKRRYPNTLDVYRSLGAQIEEK